MTEGERIAEQHRRAYHGEAWHGPAVFELLKGLTAKQAAARPLEDAHTIWEIVLHLASWEKIVRSRFVEEPIENTDEIDWPEPGTATSASWKAATAALHEESEALHTVLARTTDKRLAARRPGTSGTWYDLGHGQVQHALYHAGQIALLRKTVA
jgi:uncharacterized damage-inducible protein DinB